VRKCAPTPRKAGRPNPALAAAGAAGGCAHARSQFKLQGAAGVRLCDVRGLAGGGRRCCKEPSAPQAEQIVLLALLASMG
jgi:hypothetical protein